MRIGYDGNGIILRKLTYKSNKERLESAIEKWKLIAYLHSLGVPNVANTGADSCALCSKYWNVAKCTGCPVYKETGKRNCTGTPADSYYTNKESHVEPNKLVKFAKEEVKFLQSIYEKY